MPQPRLKTALAILAILSLDARPPAQDKELLVKATRYLLKAGSERGDMGDESFNTESHAIVVTALLSVHEHLEQLELRARVARRISRAIRHLLRNQDRSGASASRGGWKMEGRRGRANDRRASTWALLALLTTRLYGPDVPQANIDRGARFIMGAFKQKADSDDQVGGFSIDQLGLAVGLMSSMGGWVLSRFNASETWRQKNVSWLLKHPPEWSGPNYFYASFFRARVVKFESPGTRKFKETMERIAAQLAEHQATNGSILFPPGNAQNTVMMGPVFSTAMAILILNTEGSRLPFDEDYRIQHRF